MKRNQFYGNDRAFRELYCATMCRSAAKAAKMFGASPALVTLYRDWMRNHALSSVILAKLEVAR